MMDTIFHLSEAHLKMRSPDVYRNLATTGGCVIYDGDEQPGDEQPTRECLDCNHSWDARLIKTALDFKTAASLPLLSQFILENLQYYGPHKADKTDRKSTRLNSSHVAIS